MNRACFLAVTVLASIALSGTAAAQEKLENFMRVKLDHSQKTLEGLARGDFELIAKHAQAMSLLTLDETWMVIQTPEYRERSNEFRRSVDAITNAAKSKNLEAATLAYVDVTMKCVTCHQYLRSAQRP
jgi:cytochrome c556